MTAVSLCNLLWSQAGEARRLLDSLIQSSPELFPGGIQTGTVAFTAGAEYVFLRHKSVEDFESRRKLSGKLFGCPVLEHLTSRCNSPD